MARKHIPVVVDEYLWLSEKIADAAGQAIAVGSPAWYHWLADEQHLSFSFRHRDGTITARHERQRNGWYWYAYCKRAGQIHKTYLGRPGELTVERLQHSVTVLTTKIELHTRKLYSSNHASAQTKNTDLILTEKFSVPTTNTQLIIRPHLLERISRGTQNKLVLLSASAGYGKTTLLSAWCTYTRLHDAQSACAWISLDTHDNDSLTFWTHILTALNRVQEGSTDEPLCLLRATQASTMFGVLKTLINTCQTLPNDVTIIIDNYHTIQTPAIHQALGFLLDHLPTRLHIVIASRTDPPLPLTRLRLESSLTELGNDDLRFSTEETAQLLTTITQRPVTIGECIPLTEYTEGWIAGIQLASMHEKDPYRFTEELERGLSKNRYILDYLIEEVLLKQAPDIQQFLVQTSVLDRLSSSLCDAIREQTDSQLQIEKLEHLNMFLVPLNNQGQWYRYHHLFVLALRHHLHSNYPASIHRLHQRASLWYEEHDLMTLAIQHAIQARDVTLIQRLQEQQHTTREQEQAADWRSTEPTSFRSYNLPTKPTSQSQPQSAIALLDITPAQSKASQAPASDLSLLEPLTKREYDVLQQLLQGASNRDIAQCLIISEGTVKKHVSNICGKLGVQRRTQAVAKSILLALCS